LPLDLQDTLGSLLGIGGAFHALWDGFLCSQRIPTPVGQLCFLWLASSVLHITTPALISVSTAIVPIPVVVELDTIPGNIIDLGADLTYFGNMSVDNVYSQDLLDVVSAVPYLWENRNASIRLPLGVKET
jgi:hypothetical protein